MIEKAIYFGKNILYDKIRSVGGEWNDTKERPVVCLLESKDIKSLYWAIPMGNWAHRNKNAQDRISKYLNFPKRDIRSCYYHLGKTNVQSIFFISDVIPITSEYIEKEYIGYDNNLYVIKNKNLISSLEYKLSKILVFEKNKNNYFRQHITDTKNLLVEELMKKES